MHERLQLRDRFLDLRRAALEAARHYDSLAQTAPPSEVRQCLEKLARDQYRHVEMSERLLEIIGE